jgi:putative restriction endonuclease
MPPGDFDERLRAGMFAYLDRISNHGMQDVTTDQLNAFEFDGNRISLLQHMRGIRVVSGLPAALSIRTTFVARPEDRPYEDAEGPDGYFRYKWRGTDPDAHDNVALRVAMSERRPWLGSSELRPGASRQSIPSGSSARSQRSTSSF